MLEEEKGKRSDTRVRERTAVWRSGGLVRKARGGVNERMAIWWLFIDREGEGDRACGGILRQSNVISTEGTG